MSRSRLLLWVLCIQAALLCSCTLTDPCEIGFHWDAVDQKCVKDSVEACGFRLVNCKLIAVSEHASGARCINGKCETTPCELGQHWDEDAVSDEDAGSVNIAGACVPDTDKACGFDAVNCTELPGVAFKKDGANDGADMDPWCDKGVCRFACDKTKSYYHLLSFDDSSACVQKCECERDPATGSVIDDECLANGDKVKACIEILKPSCSNKGNASGTGSNVYCVENTQDFLLLDDWLKKLKSDNLPDNDALTENQPVISAYVYMMNDEDIVLNDDNIGDWEPVNLSHVSMYAFGGKDFQKKIVYSGENKLSHGLFNTISDSMIANISVDLEVEGDEAYGLLADSIHNSVIHDVNVAGSLINNGMDSGGGSLVGSIDLNWLKNEVEENNWKGVGGLTGFIDRSTLRGITAGNVENKTIQVMAENRNFVGGIAGIVSNTEITGNLEQVGIDSPEMANPGVQKVIGKSVVGGMFGVLGGGNSIKNIEAYIDTVEGQNQVGGFIGFADLMAQIEHVKNRVKHVTGSGQVGGFGGCVKGTCSNIKNTSEEVKGKTEVGGFIGESLGRYSNIINYSDHVYGDETVGGMIGSFSGRLDNAQNSVKSVEAVDVVGGMIGYVYNNAVINGNENRKVVDNEVESVKGVTNVGGALGSMEGGTINDVISKVSGHVTGEARTGGFVGHFDDGMITNAVNDVKHIDASQAEMPPCILSDSCMCKMSYITDGSLCDLEDWHEKAIGGFVGYMGKYGMIRGTVDTKSSNDDYFDYLFKNMIDKIDANNQCVGGFVGYLNGDISSVSNNVNTVHNNYEAAIYNWIVSGQRGTGGFVGCTGENSLIQHVNNKVGSVFSYRTAAGFVGVHDGYLIDVANKTGNVTAVTSHAGGFVGSVSISGHIVNAHNVVENFVYSALAAGGFAAEADGEVSGIYNKTKNVSSFGLVGGAFGACGGLASNIVSYVDRVEINEFNENLAENEDEDTEHSSYCYTNEGAKYCYNYKWLKKESENERYNYVGGFVGRGDGQHDTTFAGIISRVHHVVLSSHAKGGGFLGDFDYDAYRNRTATIENISSFANIDTKNSNSCGLFIGGIEWGRYKKNDTATLNIKNVYVMGSLNSDSNYVAGANLYKSTENSSVTLPLIHSSALYVIDDKHSSISELGEVYIRLGEDKIKTLQDYFCMPESWCTHSISYHCSSLSDDRKCMVVLYRPASDFKNVNVLFDNSQHTGNYDFGDLGGNRPEVVWYIKMSEQEKYTISSDTIISKEFLNYDGPLFTFDVVQ